MNHHSFLSFYRWSMPFHVLPILPILNHFVHLPSPHVLGSAPPLHTTHVGPPRFADLHMFDPLGPRALIHRPRPLPLHHTDHRFVHLSLCIAFTLGTFGLRTFTFGWVYTTRLNSLTATLFGFTHLYTPHHRLRYTFLLPRTFSHVQFYHTVHATFLLHTLGSVHHFHVRSSFVWSLDSGSPAPPRLHTFQDRSTPFLGYVASFTSRLPRSPRLPGHVLPFRLRLWFTTFYHHTHFTALLYTFPHTGWLVHTSHRLHTHHTTVTPGFGLHWLGSHHGLRTHIPLLVTLPHAARLHTRSSFSSRCTFTTPPLSRSRITVHVLPFDRSTHRSFVVVVFTLHVRCCSRFHFTGDFVHVDLFVVPRSSFLVTISYVRFV